MGKLLSKEDIAFSNRNFWWYYILSCRGFDDEKELNLDDAIMDVVDKDKCVPDFLSWYRKFCPENEADADGYFQKPNTIAGKLGGSIRFAIEFHSWHTTYYLNDVYIGNLGGHFEAWFFTWEELLAFDKYDHLFLLMLPMAGIAPEERQKAEKLIAEKLKAMPMFAGNATYIAACMANGLLMSGAFERAEDIGIVCSQNHSVRNIGAYPRYREDVAALNSALADFVKDGRTLSQ